MKSLQAVIGTVVMALMLSGCGGGSGSATSASGASASSTPPTTGTGTGTGTGSGSGTGTSTGSAQLAWQPPTTNTNGTALTNLAGYHIYYGTNSSALANEVVVNSPNTLTYDVTNLSSGTWYFAITAYTNSGTESAKSNVGSKTIT